MNCDLYFPSWATDKKLQSGTIFNSGEKEYVETVLRKLLSCAKMVTCTHFAVLPRRVQKNKMCTPKL